MAVAPDISLLDPTELQLEDGPQRWSLVLNQFMTAVQSGQQNRLTVGQNFAAQWHTTNFLYVPDDWVSITQFNNGFSAFTDPNIPAARVRKHSDGTVELSGLVTTPNVLPGSGTSMFTLPAGYAPDTTRGYFYASNSTGVGSFTVGSNGSVNYISGATAANFFSLESRFTASDRTPVPPGCWPYIFALDTKIFTGRPKAVLCTEIREKATNALVAAGAVDWDFTNVNNKPQIKIRNLSGPLPKKSYQFTFLVLAG